MQLARAKCEEGGTSAHFSCCGFAGGIGELGLSCLGGTAGAAEQLPWRRRSSVAVKKRGACNGSPQKLLQCL